jgi:pyrroline-5-carboxylate reductase
MGTNWHRHFWRESNTMTVTAFIGAGNISKALMGGLLSADSKASIWASDPVQSQLDTLPGAIQTTTDNLQAVEDANVVVLCVKPNMMADICSALSPAAKGKLFISVAAGITCTSLRQWLGGDAAVIRCMPNTPALIGEGMTGLFASPEASDSQKNQASNILSHVGKIAWFEKESDLDLVTAVSGSGPAYFFLMLEAMQLAAQDLGLNPEVAKTLVQQTALGAVKMAIQSDLEPGDLRRNVTSPGGTTAAAIAVLQDQGFEEIMMAALKSAANRSRELSAE